MSSKKKYKDFETALARLEKITELLETGEQPLESAIALYSEGLEISRFCDEQLKQAEAKIRIIAESNGIMKETEFEPSDED